MIKRENLVVYRYDEKQQVNIDSSKKSPLDVEWVMAQPETIKSFFPHDPGRLKTFMNFYASGYLGVILHRDGELITFLWMKTPGCTGPSHLPKRYRNLNCYWLLYGRTNKKYYGQGYVKKAIKLLIGLACRQEAKPAIYVDTDEENLPSRKAILAAGFRPAGIINCCKLNLPGLRRLVWGKWDMSALHPGKLPGKYNVSLPVIKTPAGREYTHPLLHDGWLEFNRMKWGVKAYKKRYVSGNSGPPYLDASFYCDRKGRILLPPRNPYNGLAFRPAPTDNHFNLNKQLTRLAEQLLDEMTTRGVTHGYILPPEITDVRLWQWAGFKVGVRFTYYMDFPCDIDRTINKSARYFVRKARKDGYRCERTRDFAGVVDCLAGTEARKGFTHQLTVADLYLANQLLGEDCFHAYLCYAPDGEPASAVIWLHSPGFRAIGWVSGSNKSHLSSGSSYLLDRFALEDLQASGASGVDDAGANIPGVAAFKEKMGYRLVPYYYIEPCSIKQLPRLMIDWYKFTLPPKQR